MKQENFDWKINIQQLLSSNLTTGLHSFISTNSVLCVYMAVKRYDTLNWASGGPTIMTILCLASIPSAGAIWRRAHSQHLKTASFTYSHQSSDNQSTADIDKLSLRCRSSPLIRHSPWLRLRQSVTAVWCVDPVFQWWLPLQALGWTGELSPTPGVPAGCKHVNTTWTRRSHRQELQTTWSSPATNAQMQTVELGKLVSS